MGIEPTSDPFRTCGACKSAWPTWYEFVEDPDVRLLGLQSLASHPGLNLLVFEHSCGSSISVLSRRLRHLVPGVESAAPFPVRFGGEEYRALDDPEVCDASFGMLRDHALILLIQCLKRTAQEAALA